MDRSKLPRAPKDSDRVTIVGQTGTGKTVAGVASLAPRSYDTKPWLVLNYKRDELLEQLPYTAEIGTTDQIPKHPGLYLVRPECEAGSVDGLLNRAHRRAVMGGGGCGFYIDEGYEVGQHSLAFKRVLTQGRSLELPTITLSQRPVWMLKNVFSEMTFLQVFPLLDYDDRKLITKWLPQETINGTPIDVNYPERLGEYESLYFDAGRRSAVVLGPMPFGEQVLNMFDRRVPKPPAKKRKFGK